MTVKEILEIVDGHPVCGDNLDAPIEMICASDLMSDILTLEPEKALLVTGLANIQAIRTAEMADIEHILFVREKDIPHNMKQLAEESGITLAETALGMYEACGKLYAAGLPGGYKS
ncbi:MAG: hypothetical protein PQJ60_02280 [Spirochaetales bacterium]|nr:hypothetical protein [Spirochaetales bacterium]